MASATRKRTNNINSPLNHPSQSLVSPTRGHRFIYTFTLLSILLVAYYAYRIARLEWKTEIGSWSNFALLYKTPPRAQPDPTSANGRKTRGSGNTNDDARASVEDRINALAEALGMPSKELASAIAGAVRAYVPSASLSSIKAEETGVIVDELVGGSGSEGKVQEVAESESGWIANGFDSFVGMDEP